jgi:retinol dehydrogenase 12
MNGRLVVITGATAGIGKAAAFELARLGATLALVSRNPAKADSVAGEIRAEVPDAEVSLFTADLSELKQVRVVADELAARFDHIDVLVNNAGIAASKARETVDGFDEMLAANYLGPFLLTHLVLDLVRPAPEPRVVIVGSDAHRFTNRFDPERFEHLGNYTNPLTAQLAYGRTKLLDILFADELARRLASTNITVNSLCPGLVGTDLASETGLADRALRALTATPLVRTPEQGARMTVRLATDPALAGVTGGFFSSTPLVDRLPRVGARRNPEIARRVYERTCDLVGVSPLTRD